MDRTYPGRSFRLLLMVCGVMVFATAIFLHLPALKNNFVNLDDGAYVYENRHIHSLSLQSARWMLTTFYAANWHPLAWLSHAVDYAFFGLNPRGHHLTSIVLHGLNTLLVFLLSIQVMLKAKAPNHLPPFSAFTAPAQLLIAGCGASLLFGVHPVHVESVAWVAERKDVLCAFFFILTLCSYLFYVSSDDAKIRRVWFTVCLLLAAAALTAKPMAVTLPAVLLVLDMYPLRRINLSQAAGGNLRVVAEKIPFLLLSFISSVLTILAQHAGGAFESLEKLPLYFRMVHAMHVPLFYLAKMIWPAGLVPYYAFPKVITTAKIVYYGISCILTLSITGWCLGQWKRDKPLFFVAWAYYLIMLLPVAGIMQVGGQAAADRYTYLPSLSIFLLTGVGVAGLFTKCAGRKNLIVGGGVVAFLICAALGQRTITQIAVWRDSESLWRHVIRTFPGRVPIAHNNLGVLYDDRGLHDQALEEYKKALAINPSFADALANLGAAYMRSGDSAKAIETFQKALAGNPNMVEARNNLGLAYFHQGMDDEAVAEYQKALQIDPLFAAAHYNLGLAYYALKMHDKALEEYKKVVALNPSFAEAHYKLGLIYYEKKNYSLAKNHMEKARQLGYKISSTIADLIIQAPSHEPPIYRKQ